MALIVEDGTGKVDAESYCSVDDADTHHAARGVTNWATLSTAEKEQALRRACDYMEANYGTRWAGERYTDTQALSWPRIYVPRRTKTTDYNNDEIPVEVVRANAELAFRAAAGDLLADVGTQVKSETVGPISVTYADGARQSTVYKAVDNMLAFLFRYGGSGQIPVIRA